MASAAVAQASANAATSIGCWSYRVPGNAPAASRPAGMTDSRPPICWTPRSQDSIRSPSSRSAASPRSCPAAMTTSARAALA